MEYIRKQKSQSTWEANTKHCLYGLDADLIMLSLTTHEPHFILLREEVLKNRNAKKEADRFHLLHISLLREYLQLEFKSMNGFNADIERVIDDFVLMCFFVGNDFLPNLPNQDIADGALNTFLELYKKLLPRWKNYLTNKSVINLGLLEELLFHIAKGERDFFDLPVATHLENTLNISSNSNKNNNKNSKNNNNNNSNFKHSSGQLSSSDEFLGLQDSGNSLSDSGESHQTRRKKFINDMLRVGIDVKQEEDEMDKLREDDQSWKDIYYKDKFQVTIQEIEYISKLTHTYIEGLTWVLNYYHNGCISWGWYYPYHYAPLASDLTHLNAMNINFELGQPFFPYQQLLAVLPRESSKFLPIPYQELMNSPNSPIIDFYPSDIQLDMNGKKNSWESIVLIPFIDQKRLVDAINKIDVNRLTKEEIAKNQFGPSYIYYFDSKTNENVTTTFPGLFENLQGCNVVEKVYTLPGYPTGKHEGFRLCSGVKTGVESPNGFPSMYHLKFTSTIKPIHINVFGSNSRKESVLLTLDNSICINEEHELLIKQFKSLIGTTCYVNYPYLKEGIITSISDNSCHFYSDKNYIWNKTEKDNWSKEAAFAYNKSFSTKAIDMGDTSIVFHVKLLNNLVEHIDGSVTKQYATNETMFAYQTVVFNVSKPDERYQERKALPITELFPINDKVIYIGKDAYVKGIAVMQYGSLATITAHEPSGTISIDIIVGPRPPSFGTKIAQSSQDAYYPMYSVARSLGISTRALSKITGTVTFEPGRQNVGLSMKFSSRNEQVLGYTRKLDQSDNNNNNNGRGPQWEFSQKAIDVIAEYLNKFPRIFDLLEEKPDASTYQIDELEIDEEIDITTIRPVNTSSKVNSASLSSSVGAPDKDIESDEESDDEFDNLVLEADGASQRTKNIRYLKTIKEWLKTLEIRTLPRVPCGSKTLSPEGIKKIEESSNKFVEFSLQQTTKRTITGVKPSFLLAPLPSLPDNLASFVDLGDRVLIATRDSPIPFGAQATVVAIKGNYVDVVLDLPNIAATSLGKKCSELRGATLLKQCLLNLSNPPNERSYRQQQQQQQQQSNNNRQDFRERQDNRQQQYTNNNSRNNDNGFDNRGGGRNYNNRGGLNKSDSEVKNTQDNNNRGNSRQQQQQRGYSNAKSSDSITDTNTPQYKPKQQQQQYQQKQEITTTAPTTTTKPITTTVPTPNTTNVQQQQQQAPFSSFPAPPTFYPPQSSQQQQQNASSAQNILGLNMPMGQPMTSSGNTGMDPQVLLAQQSLALQQQILMQMQLQQQQQQQQQLLANATAMYPNPYYPMVPPPTTAVAPNPNVYNPNMAPSTSYQVSSYPTNTQVRHAQPLNWQQQQQLNDVSDEYEEDFSVNSGANNTRKHKPRHHHNNNSNNNTTNGQPAYRNNNNQQQQQYEQREYSNNNHNNNRRNNNNNNKRDQYNNNKSTSTWAPKKSTE